MKVKMVLLLIIIAGLLATIAKIEVDKAQFKETAKETAIKMSGSKNSNIPDLPSYNSSADHS